MKSVYYYASRASRAVGEFLMLFIVLSRLSERAEFVDDRRQSRHFRQLEVLVVVGVEWDAYVACLGMDAEW